MSSSHESNTMQLSTEKLAILMTTLRRANQRYDTVAKHHKSSLSPSHHARLRAQRLGLAISTERARQCPQQQVSLIPLPILETEESVEHSRDARPVLARLEIPDSIADLLHKPLPPLPQDIIVEEARDTDAAAMRSAEVRQDNTCPTLSSVIIDCEELQWVFEDVELCSAFESDSDEDFETDGESSSPESASPATPCTLGSIDQANAASGFKRKCISFEKAQISPERPCKYLRTDWIIQN